MQGAFGAAHLAAAAAAPIDLDELYIPPDGAKFEEIATAATEQVNPRSAEIGTMSAAEMVDLFVEEEYQVGKALASKRVEIARAVELITSAFKNDGRLFYIGAGTSGRLGTLDASEIPPTFGEPPHRVQAIMAGSLGGVISPGLADQQKAISAAGKTS